MKFETQGNGGQSQGNDIPQEVWDTWNDYYWGLMPTTEESTKKSDGSVVENSFTKKITKVGLCNMFIDCGLQPQQDSEYDSKLEAGTADGEKGHGVEGMPEGYSEAEKEHVRKYPDNYFQTVEGKRKQFKPERPTQEIYAVFDIPDIEIDWTKHPIEKIQKLGVKPLRVSVNGYFSRRNSNKDIVWEGFGKSLRFNPNWKTGKLSPNNPIMKLATSMSLATEFENSEYDFDKLLGGAANVTFTISARKEDGNLKAVYSPNFKSTGEIVDLDIPNIGKVSREQQIPECTINPVSVMLNQESFSDEILEIVSNKRELKAVLPKATSFQPNAKKAPDFWLGCNWEDTNLKKALDNFNSSSETSSTSTEKPTQGDEETVDKSSEGVTQKPQYNEPLMDFDDDIPF